MWEKNTVSIKKAKELIEALSKIWLNKEFVIEILEAINGNIDIADKLLEFMKNGPELVPAEVYDELTALTAGRFIKEFSTTRSAKKACINGTEVANWEALFSELLEAELFLVCEWDLSDEEKERFLRSNVGDTIHIESQMTPLILWDKNMDAVVIPVYTSVYEIPCKYKTDKFAIQQVTWEYVKALYDAFSKVKGRVVIALDIDSDDFLEISSDKLSMFLK